MKRLSREDIHIISRGSNWSEQGISKALKTHVYNDRAAWQKFLRLFFIALGVGFTVAGIVFFFAYNWAYLHRFVKLGLVEGLLLIVTVFALLPKINETTRNIVLTGASVLVGVLFAVFGQIYQTGANAYDFFLAWTICIVLWTVVAGFAPLWLLFISLINTTIVLYAEQVANHWSGVWLCTLLFMVNAAFLIASIFLFQNNKKVPTWFSNIVALGAASAATIGITTGIYEQYEPAFPILSLLTTIAFAAGIMYGLKTRSGFYLSIIPFSFIIIVSALLIRVSEGEAMFLLVSLFIIASVTLVIKNLIAMQKKWADEN